MRVLFAYLPEGAEYEKENDRSVSSGVVNDDRVFTD